jgi:hypothetical protein
MGLLRALVVGAIGSAVLTAVHEAGRARLAHAPRMDVFGKRALRRAGVRARGRELERYALGGDLLANAAFYAFAARGLPRRAPWRGLALGLAAGAGALALPQRLGLGKRPSRRHTSTAALTVAWYTLGGLAAGLASRGLSAQRALAPRRIPAGAATIGGHTLTRGARWYPFPATV